MPVNISTCRIFTFYKTVFVYKNSFRPIFSTLFFYPWALHTKLIGWEKIAGALKDIGLMKLS
jgi:hypothetical protein